MSELRAIDEESAVSEATIAARARELDLLRFELEEIEARRSSPRRGRDAGGAGRCARESGPQREALEAAAARSTGRRPTRSARPWARATKAGSSSSPPASRPCRPKWANSCTSCGSRPSRWSTTPIGWPSSSPPPAASRAGAQVRPDDRRRRAFATETAARLAELEGAEELRATLGERREARALLAGPEAPARGAPGAPPPELAAAVTERLGELALAGPSPHRGRRAAEGVDGARGHVPARSQPGRVGAAAGQRRVGWRAVARDARAARGALGNNADPGVRRGRRGHRRRGGAAVGRALADARRPPPDAVRHAPRAGRRAPKRNWRCRRREPTAAP